MGVMQNEYNISTGKHEGKTICGRMRHRQRIIIKNNSLDTKLSYFQGKTLTSMYLAITRSKSALIG
jgi:hypothetical protein